EKVVDALGVDRDPSINPLFQTMLVLHNTPVPEVELGGVTLSGMDVDTGTAKFDLSLELRETPSGVDGFIEYNADLFEADTIARMARHLLRLIDEAVARPAQPVSTLPLLADDER